MNAGEAGQPETSPTHGHSFLYLLSGMLFMIALAGVVGLVGWDLFHHLGFTLHHQHIAAWPLSTIGLSYICLQLGSSAKIYDKLKGIFLGLAFVLWGGEQLLPPTHLVTVMDECVVAIFVLDLSLIIFDRLVQRP